MKRGFHSTPRRRAMVAMVIALLLIPSAVLAQSAPAVNDGLEPGEHVTYEQEVPINVVFVGYEQGDFTLNDLKGVLPESYAPIVRYPAFYGLAGRDMGLQFNFDYTYKFANNAFENDFFDYLADVGTPGPMTSFQADYNAQANNVMDVTDPVLYIDAPAAEWWLMDNADRLDIDPATGYTIFFINWYGRSDFQFHLYTKTDEPDPDTGYNFGEVRATRKMIAWGGTHGRTWFYDLSAGPEAWTDNWNVDDPDLDGDGEEEYRMPAIWEYTAGGFRNPNALGEDLGLVARFVAINLIFTPSPLYDPLASSPGPEGDKILHVEMFEIDGNGRVQGTDYYNADLAGELMEAFQPYYSWQSAVDLNPRTIPGVQRAFRIFTGRALLNGCWQEFGDPFAQLFCFFDNNYSRFVPAYGPQDYVAAQFAFHTTGNRLGDQFGLLGFADDDWMTGTPSYVFTFGAEDYRLLGYGFTSTVVHEGGHHIGLSHPHDGYDAELGIDYGPGGPFYFVWSGDESDTVMNYFGTSNTFGKFNEDSMNRYIFAGYLNWANMILADIEAHPGAASVQHYVDAADTAAMMAQEAFWGWEYGAAAANARTAYEQIALAAMELGISTDMVAPLRAITPTGMPPKEGDPIRFPNNLVFGSFFLVLVAWEERSSLATLSPAPQLPSSPICGARPNVRFCAIMPSFSERNPTPNQENDPVKIVKKYPDGVFSWIDLSTTDIAAAQQFYSGLFGWEVDETPIADSGTFYTNFRLDGYTVAGGGQMMPEMIEAGAPPVWISYVNVDDIDAAAARATEAGGVVFMPPMDVLDVGRMALVQDPTGAPFGMWQPGTHIGAQVVNQPNSLVWNELQTRDAAAADAFYHHVFGWSKRSNESGDYLMWDRDGRAHCGALALGDDWGADVPSNWLVYFLVEDVDATAARLAELGGGALHGPVDMAGMGRFMVAQDPQGAVFAVVRYNGPADEPPGTE